MHSFLTRPFSNRFAYKSPGAAFAGILCVLAIAGCSSNHNTVQTKPSVITNVGYTLPAKSETITQIKTAKATPLSSAIEKTRAKPVVKVSASNYLGRAPHICTPSGFGSKTRCFLRS